MEKTFEFDCNLQTEIVSCLAFDCDFHRRSDGLIDYNYFESLPERILAKIAIDHYKTYREVPSNTVWVELIKDNLKSGNIKAGDAREVVVKLKEISELTVRSRPWLLDRIAEFAKHQAVTNAMMQSARAITKSSDPDRFKKIEKVMSDAFSVALHEEDEDYDYFERIDERTQRREDYAAGKITASGITTGIKELDGILFHKGWGIQELSLLMGGAKSTKSFMLTTFAGHAVMAGKNVLFVTLENSIEITSLRFDALISEIGMDRQYLEPLNIKNEISSKAKSSGLLKMRWAATGTLTPNKLQTWIDDYKTKGVIFDLVVIDYVQLMAPNYRTDDKIENSASIVRDIRAIAQIENCAMLSAVQSNREGHKSAVLQAHNISEDFNIIRVADIVLSINRTDEEKAVGKVRIGFVVSRSSPDGFTLFCKQNLNLGLGVSEVESVE